MSFFENQLTGLAGTLIGKFLTVRPTRSFGEFTGFCSVTESHSAAIEATDYPIEDGTHGTDHIIKQPDNILWDVGFDGSVNAQETYEKLLALMKSGELFDATTGLKTYRNMILLSISAYQDFKTGRVLRCTLTMREVIITRAIVTTLPPRARQAVANLTDSTAKTGTKSLADPGPKPKSQLLKLMGGL